MTSTIGWQHSVVLSLFLHAVITAHLQKYGGPDSENLNKPQLAACIDEMDDEDREKYFSFSIFYYVGTMGKKLDVHIEAMMHERGAIRRKISQHTGELWEANNIPLKADLIHMSQNSGSPPCPMSLVSSRLLKH
ncbi:hypothetical protein K431DRAFT_329244 [Polychaeton citri CBS 116435]|uniref:Uncharacterized protein n=1 Tax=Polychaeton citri CBS 116435 TaxID=1314669 RepID=A0A9P4QIV3_9PEZI|nr:hypothetical protein K431DRAFT_329244 [Polychaeton citri CBS 116435]